jgi:hypothetical protein
MGTDPVLPGDEPNSGFLCRWAIERTASWSSKDPWLLLKLVVGDSEGRTCKAWLIATNSLVLMTRPI